MFNKILGVFNFYTSMTLSYIWWFMSDVSHYYQMIQDDKWHILSIARTNYDYIGFKLLLLLIVGIVFSLIFIFKNRQQKHLIIDGSISLAAHMSIYLLGISYPLVPMVLLWISIYFLVIRRGNTDS